MCWRPLHETIFYTGSWQIAYSSNMLVMHIVYRHSNVRVTRTDRHCYCHAMTVWLGWHEHAKSYRQYLHCWQGHTDPRRQIITSSDITIYYNCPSSIVTLIITHCIYPGYLVCCDGCYKLKKYKAYSMMNLFCSR